MHFNAGGADDAAFQDVQAKYELPNMPTSAVEPGRSAAQATESYPSSTSLESKL